MKSEVILGEIQARAANVEKAMREIDDGVSLVIANGPYGTHEYRFISKGNDSEGTYTCGWSIENLRQMEFVFKLGELKKLVLNGTEELDLNIENSGTVVGHLTEFARLINSCQTYNTQF